MVHTVLISEADAKSQKINDLTFVPFIHLDEKCSSSAFPPAYLPPKIFSYDSPRSHINVNNKLKPYECSFDLLRHKGNNISFGITLHIVAKAHSLPKKYKEVHDEANGLISFP